MGNKTANKIKTAAQLVAWLTLIGFNKEIAYNGSKYTSLHIDNTKNEASVYKYINVVLFFSNKIDIDTDVDIEIKTNITTTTRCKYNVYINVSESLITRILDLMEEINNTQTRT